MGDRELTKTIENWFYPGVETDSESTQERERRERNQEKIEEYWEGKRNGKAN